MSHKHDSLLPVGMKERTRLELLNTSPLRTNESNMNMKQIQMDVADLFSALY
jgi:hypothetical protein